MCKAKKLGNIFGLFFILISFVNFAYNPCILRLNVIGLFCIGICYLLTTLKINQVSKLIQILLILFYGCIALIDNDGNSLVSLFCYSISVSLCGVYFNKSFYYSFCLLIPYILTGIFIGWEWVYILANIILYIAYTTILFIIQEKE